MKKLYPIACLIFVLTLIAQNAEARELEIINWGNTDIFLCIGETKSVTQSGAGGSWIAHYQVVSGWKKVAAHSKIKVKTSSSRIELLINTGPNRYATFSKYEKREHFIHPTAGFENKVTGGSGQVGKDKGSIRIKGKPWIRYGNSKTESPDIPLKYGFVRKTFYRVPSKIKGLNINRNP